LPCNLNKSARLSLATDADYGLSQLDSSLFLGIPSDVEAHSGFASHQARYANDKYCYVSHAHADNDDVSTAPTILSAVKTALSKHGASSITVVGHSLGGALALLDGVYFRLQFSKTVSVRVITYGMPRVGSQAFADFVDSKLSGLVTRVTNREDFVPIVPDFLSGFFHPSGEIHIQDSGAWDACPGTFTEAHSHPACGVVRTSDVMHVFRSRQSF